MRHLYWFLAISSHSMDITVHQLCSLMLAHVQGVRLRPAHATLYNLYSLLLEPEQPTNFSIHLSLCYSYKLADFYGFTITKSHFYVFWLFPAFKMAAIK